MATTNTQLDGRHRDHDQTSVPILPGSSKGPPKRLYNHPPALCEGFPSIDLDRLALKKIDRRNALRSKNPVILKRKRKTNNIIRFARRGGPDLSHLRGYASIQDPRRDTHIEFVDWDEASSSDSMVVSRPYNAAFERHLVMHNVYTDAQNLEPDNLDGLRDALEKRRPSVSSLTAEDYRAFLESNFYVLTEQAVALHVMPKILGPDDAGYHCVEDLTMDGLAHVVQGTPVPRPDYFDGVPYADVDPRVVAELKWSIVPMAHMDNIRCPLAPNFFLEIEGPDGDPATLPRRICHYGSFGVRAMHALDTVGRGQPADDADDDDDDNGRAIIPHVFTATYYSKTAHLAIYCHFMSAPTTAEEGASGQGNSAYHMKVLKQYHLFDKFETFVQGVTALRNVRSMAKDARDRLVEAANRSVREAKAS